MSKPNPTPPSLTEQDIQRFWSYVDKSPGQGPNGDCWGWTGTPTRDGYGMLTASGHRSLRSNRLAFFLATGIWSVINILHRCDNRPCCNPGHLFEGTADDNNKDRKRKGRSNPAHGEVHYKAILTEEMVRSIRLTKGTMTQRERAEMFGVKLHNIQSIDCGRVWKHVTV